MKPDLSLTAEELLASIPPHVLAKQKADTERVRQLCEELGYGFVIGQASDLWRKKDSTGAHVVGPCAFFTAPCPCERRGSCDLCYGCGWNFKKAELENGKVCRHADECDQCGYLLRILARARTEEVRDRDLGDASNS